VNSVQGQLSATDFRFLLESVPNAFRRRPSSALLRPELFISRPVDKSPRTGQGYLPKKMTKSVRQSELSTRIHHLPPNYFATRLDRLVSRGRRCARRVGVHSTPVVALRVVSRSSSGIVRDVPPNLHARTARDGHRRPLPSLPRLRSRSERVDNRPRADVRESHTAKATVADGASHRLRDPARGFGALRSPA
jgi:hypothetical protein